MNRLALLSLGISTFSTIATHGQVLFSDPLDSEAAANVLRLDDSQDPDPDITVNWVDYSNFTIDGVAHAIPEAPNPVDGGAATRGLVIQANLFVGGAFAVNFLAADSPGGDPVAFTGDYKLSFDAYISVADPVPSGGTEQLLWGIGSDGTEINARYIRQLGLGSGVWGWLAGENGYGTEDATIQEGADELFDLGDTQPDEAAPFNAAFEDTIPASTNNIPANQWVHVEISALAGTVRVQFNGVTFFDAEATATEGFAFLGYEDTFSSISGAPAYQWGLFDNFVVEVAEPETIIATLAGSFPVTNDGTPGDNIVKIENRHTTPINITAVSFTGPDAAEFSTGAALPLSVASGTTVDLTVTCTPTQPTGSKSAELVLTTDDATTPEITLPLSATFAPELLAHYPLDETSGAVLTEASGNGSNATLAQNTPALLGQPPLASGTAIRFDESIFVGGGGSTGNFALFPMLHTPSLSFAAWINPVADSSSEDVIVNRSFKNGNTDDLYGLFIDDSGTLTFSIAGNPVVFSAFDAILDDTPYHVAFTHLDEDGLDNDTATRTRLYINGNIVAEVTGINAFGYGPLSPDAQQKNVFVASRSQAASGYSGLIDDIQIYSVELTPEQVANAFANPGTLALDPPPAPAPLVITAVSRDDVLGDVTINFTSSAGKTYAVQTSSDLITWNDDGPDSIPATGDSTTTVVTGLATTHRYLRVIQE